MWDKFNRTVFRSFISPSLEFLKEEDVSKDLIDKDTAIEILETIYLDKVNV